MNYALQTLNGQHLGFLVMAANDDDATSGQCLFRAQSSDPSDMALVEYQTLTEIAALSPLYWHFHSGQAQTQIVNADKAPLGHIKDEWLFLNGRQYLLVDLVGIL